MNWCAVLTIRDCILFLSQSDFNTTRVSVFEARGNKRGTAHWKRRSPQCAGTFQNVGLPTEKYLYLYWEAGGKKTGLCKKMSQRGRICTESNTRMICMVNFFFSRSRHRPGNSGRIISYTPLQQSCRAVWDFSIFCSKTKGKTPDWVEKKKAATTAPCCEVEHKATIVIF